MPKPAPERRKYLRVKVPLGVRVISKGRIVLETKTKDISPLGLRFDSAEAGLNINDEIELKIEIPGRPSPVHAKAKIVWEKKLSTENGSPYGVGCEFIKIEEDNKNTFLKYFCDLLYARKEGV